MKTVTFCTLGCKLNYAETAALERQFVERGFSIVSFGEPADVCVVNSCTVTERADRQCRQLIRRGLRNSPEVFMIVLGCYAQLEPEAIASIHGVDLVLGTAEKSRIFEFAGDFRKGDAPRIHVSSAAEASSFGEAYSGAADGRTRAFLKVQDGCDFNCSFCTIPLARGRSRSQSIDAVVRQAKQLAGEGYREIVLTGVNVGDYGANDGGSLLQLLRVLVQVDGLERLRLSSVEPNLLSDELIRFWLGSEKICNHFHIPLQSGSDPILRLMRRRYTTAQYRTVIDTIRGHDPHAGIGVDVIAGFPGETDQLFDETQDFLRTLPVTYLHVFTYSERPNTPSMALPDRVEPRVRFGRSEQLRILARKKKESFAASQLGRVLPVLVEGSVDTNMLSGYTSNYVHVTLPYRPWVENTVQTVLLKEQSTNGCFGEITGNGSRRVAHPALDIPSVH